MIPDDNYIIIFDGVCNFCNYWVNFIIDHDKSKKFRFTAFQSEIGLQLLDKFNLPKEEYDSFILISNGRFYKKSSAAFIVAKNLNNMTKFLAVFQILPVSLTDFIYDVIAKNRYKIFGKRDVCRIPTQEEKARFL